MADAPDRAVVVPPLVTIPGRYSGPAMTLDGSQFNEVRITMGGEDAFYNAFDLLEAALAVAWSVDAEETVRVLAAARERGYDRPQIGPES